MSTFIDANLNTLAIRDPEDTRHTLADLIARVRDLRNFLTDVDLDNFINPEDGVAYNTDAEEDEIAEIMPVLLARQDLEAADHQAAHQMLRGLRAIAPSIPACAVRAIKRTTWDGNPEAAAVLAVAVQTFAMLAVSYLADRDERWRGMAEEGINNALVRDDLLDCGEAQEAFDTAIRGLLRIAGLPDFDPYDADERETRIHHSALEAAASALYYAFTPIEDRVKALAEPTDTDTHALAA